MATVKHGWIDSDGLRLHYLDYGGTGRQIVLLHGVVGHAWMWHDVAPLLTRYGRVTALEFRGCGASQWSVNQAYSTKDLVEDLRTFLDSETSEPVDLVGFSWGASVALLYASQFPDRVRRLTLVDMPPSQPGSETDVPPMSAEFNNFDDALGEERYVNQFASDAMIQVMATHGTRPGTAGRFIKKHDPFFLERWPFRSDDLWNEAESVEHPVLLVHADQSFIWNAEEAESMVARMQNARLIHVPDSGHLIPVDNPVALAGAIGEFLND